MLLAHPRLHAGSSAAPSSLLPLVPLALAALTYRTRGWTPAVRTDALTSTDDEPPSFSALVWALDDQERLFKWRAAAPGGVTDAVLAGLRLVSRTASAVFRMALAEPGTEVEVTLDGRPLRYRARRGEAAGPAPGTGPRPSP
ncbi:putative protein OS=Streptomyces fumanus OX=67302 GN=GCM10018772_19100 PE=4 SV=1 [Streptomyces fumanus]|uniref:Uncharacterized protein n=1 Tax=Streptomyces fumanus TaxID=67302 RepID=A0A919AAR9_9ACTN|nr:hypothetical protein GCM10018772_19100 [Streptomyces fumanus]